MVKYNLQKTRCDFAEKFISLKPENLPDMSDSAIQKVINDLYAHHVEVEKQNQKLRKTQLELEKSRLISEKNIRELNDELEQRVLERTLKLEEANKELEAFSYSVSHDLCAPLRHMTGFAELLYTGSNVHLDDKGRHYLTVIIKSAQRLSALIDNLLHFSKSGRGELNKEFIDLNVIIEEVIKELSEEINGRTIKWEIQKLPIPYVDRNTIKLVWLNLLSNALKYTRLRKDAFIEIGTESSQKNENVFYVKDNGIGFDMKYIDKLFGVFQRLHSREDFEGTGIGLANVRRIIHRHNGRTWAHGKVGKGAVFYFSIPKLKRVI